MRRTHRTEIADWAHRHANALLIAGVAVLLVIALLLALAPATFAAGGNVDYGKNFADWAVTNLKPIWSVIASLCALSLILPGVRKPSIIGSMAAVLFVSGMVIFAGPAVQQMIRDISDRVANGA
jgi:hypothetical protein